ncbi:hypothetical protein FISHEDRAFT_34580, partial [Fistulina hepatica ATCC 64428]
QVLTLVLLCGLAVFITLLIIYILNPDKEPLPWRAYCAAPTTHIPPEYFMASPSSSVPLSELTSGYREPQFPPPDLDGLPPAGIFLGVFTVDSAFERRMLARTTWASHQRSRVGAGSGDGGMGTSRTVVRFVLGQPRKDWERRIQLEMDMYHDIIVLPVSENMNAGKTHTFFSWASINAWVPPVYSRPNITTSSTHHSYANYSAQPPLLAPHDSVQAWDDYLSSRMTAWVRPDFVLKADDDSFIMLAELEARLRVELHTKLQMPAHDGEVSNSTTLVQRDHDDTTSSLAPTRTPLARAIPGVDTSHDPLIYWGYLVSNRLNRFMAGELYGLSWALVDWVAQDPVVKTMVKGAEDKQTAKWMRAHPHAMDIRWISERCWIYDHPRSSTVYAHGFLFPSEVRRVQRTFVQPSVTDDVAQDVLSPPSLTSTTSDQSATPSQWAYSSVSTFGTRYSPPISGLSSEHSIEALVEGSEMSMLREGFPMAPEYAWIHREGRRKQYEGQRVGGTVAVHYIKKHMWFVETALALLEGDEYSDAEKFEKGEPLRSAVTNHGVPAKHWVVPNQQHWQW